MDIIVDISSQKYGYFIPRPSTKEKFKVRFGKCLKLKLRKKISDPV
jgi:hypothetical protein